MDMQRTTNIADGRRILMKLGMDHIGRVTEDKLKFLQQLGVDGIMAEPDVEHEERGYFSREELKNLSTRAESHGLKLEAVSHFQSHWNWAYKWMLGLPGRDEQIENCHKTIRNMGATGVPILSYNIHAMRFYRTSRDTPARGGALATSFDAELAEDIPLMKGGPGIDTILIPESHRRPIGDEQMWDNLAYFLKAVVPVAERAGVKLALHPDDPPIPSIAGVARIMRSPEAFRRAIGIVPSDNSGLLFCQGCFTEMGANVIEEIRYFGSRKKIFWVHFRNVRGTAGRFTEAFPDDGQMDMLEAMRAYSETGYEGHLAPDHRLGIVGDSEWGHRYWAFALGYMRGLMKAVETK
jgi:mannonate dehydratase